MKRNKNKSSFFKLVILAVLAVSFPLFSNGDSKVIDDVDYIYLHIGLQVDYPLPENFKKEKLKFEGNYARYTSAIFRKAKNDIRFKPKRHGSAVMIIKDQDKKIIRRLHIDIQKDNLHKIAAELRDLLVSIDGIEVKIYNKQVFVDGQVLLPREMDRVNEVISKYGSNLVRSLVKFSPEAQKKIAEIVEKEIGHPEITVRYAYNRFLLEGCVSTEQESSKAHDIADLYTQWNISSVGQGAARRGGPTIKNNLTHPCESERKAEEEEKKKEQIKKLIQIVVHFVEMEKNFNKGFLFEWRPAMSEEGTQVTASTGTSPNAPHGITAVLTATVSNFFPKLNWAKGFNFVRVLHNSSILVEEEQNGVIKVETALPQLRHHVAQPIQAQVTTAVTPKIIGDRKNLIHMQIQVHVSSPAATPSATTTRAINTILHVRDGSSAVIGGLISSSLQREYSNQPGESRAPLFNLHSSKQYNTGRSQFVVFITPLIKSSSSVGVERIKRKFRLNE